MHIQRTGQYHGAKGRFSGCLLLSLALSRETSWGVCQKTMQNNWQRGGNAGWRLVWSVLSDDSKIISVIAPLDSSVFRVGVSSENTMVRLRERELRTGEQVYSTACIPEYPHSIWQPSPWTRSLHAQQRRFATKYTVKSTHTRSLSWWSRVFLTRNH